MQLISLFLDTVKMQKSKLCWSNEKVICMFVRWIEKKSFSFFSWKIYLFICTECLYSGKSGCQWQNNNLSFTNFFYCKWTISNFRPMSRGWEKFLSLFLLSKHFYLDETNKLWLFLSLYGGTLFSAFLTVGYLYWVSPSFKKRKYFVVVVMLLISASFCFHTFSKRNISKLLYIKPIIIWLSSKSYLRKQNYFRIS